MHAALFARRAALTVALNTTTAFGTTVGPPGLPVSNTISATPSGGTPPDTYAWARTSGDARVTAINPTSASTAFTPSSGLAAGESISATFVLTVTDSAAKTAASATVNVTLERDVSGGGGGGH